MGCWKLCVLVLLPLLSCALPNEEAQLIKELFSNYDEKTRPVRSVKDIIQVQLKLTLTNLISLNEKEEMMTTNVWLQLLWDDYRLTWNSSEYGGIEVLRIRPDMVWLPEIVMENNIDGQFEVAYYANVLVRNDGFMSWLPPAIFRSTCSIEVTYFPFDWQNCTLVFRSQTYNAKEVDLQLADGDSGEPLERVDIDPEAFTENGEWAIKHCPAWKYVNPSYTEDDLQYQQIIFGLIIQRKPLFYVVNIIVPCVLISSLVVLVYFLPAKAGGQKCTLSINVLLAQTVFLFLIAQKVPETSLSVPLIGKYLIFVMTVSTIIVLSCVIVLNVSLRTPSTHNLTVAMKHRLLEVLPRYLQMKIEPCEGEEETPRERRKSSLGIMLKAEEYVLRKPRSELMFERQRERHGMSRDDRGHRGEEKGSKARRGQWRWQIVGGFDVGVTTPLFKNLAHCAPEIKECVEACNFIATSTRDQNKSGAEMENWVMIGKVLDVLCFWGALPLFVVGTLAIFFMGHFNSAPEHPFLSGDHVFPPCSTTAG
ncbi:acetylcholine receptor subunit epsilon-like isoform X1 [Bufo bufo]|uniref:acetylcholine receptor subunit epsilon-like isoform X1 n=1 Tax=Bufo bufo TaxID=8384 RepID=UPI001ABEB06A|nr:acetylcholine receptor subunit epsilon-like isoform X1 [Bufo bufo]